MVIIACPFCEWSAAYTSDNKEREARLTKEYSEHLDAHANEGASK